MNIKTILVGGTTTATIVQSGVVIPATGWASSNTAVATVNSSGIVTGTGTGVAQISAVAGGVTYTGSVTVNPVPATAAMNFS